MHTEHTGVLAYVARCLNTPASGTVLHIQCYILNIIACAIELKGRHTFKQKGGLKLLMKRHSFAMFEG